MTDVIPIERIEQRIFLMRGHKVMLDSDLAQLYGVATKVLIQAVKRNIERFPSDFMFPLENHEVTILRSQFVTLNAQGHGKHRKYAPYAFTEYGVAMLSSVLNSSKAIQVNIQIMRTFGKLREMLIGNKELSQKLAQLEKKYDHQFKVVFDAIKELMTPPNPSVKRRIGF